MSRTLQGREHKCEQCRISKNLDNQLCRCIIKEEMHSCLVNLKDPRKRLSVRNPERKKLIYLEENGANSDFKF